MKIKNMQPIWHQLFICLQQWLTVKCKNKQLGLNMKSFKIWPPFDRLDCKKNICGWQISYIDVIISHFKGKIVCSLIFWNLKLPSFCRFWEKLILIHYQILKLFSIIIILVGQKICKYHCFSLLFIHSNCHVVKLFLLEFNSYFDYCDW